MIQKSKPTKPALHHTGANRTIMKKRPNLLFYLLLNIIVSAATTLGVLWAWDNLWGGGPKTSAPPAAVAENTAQPGNTVALPGVMLENPAPSQTAPAAAAQEPPAPTETPLPADALLIEISSVVGAGDIQQEFVLLKRVGEGNLRMVGWKLVGENNTYTFPEQPELTLYKDGAVQVYTRSGTDTVTEVYWNRTEAAWRSGDTLRLLDPQGNERAAYTIP